MHMSPDSNCMINCRSTTSSCTFGDGKRVHAEQVGDVVLEVDSDHGINYCSVARCVAYSIITLCTSKHYQTENCRGNICGLSKDGKLHTTT